MNARWYDPLMSSPSRPSVFVFQGALWSTHLLAALIALTFPGSLASPMGRTVLVGGSFACLFLLVIQVATGPFRRTLREFERGDPKLAAEGFQGFQGFQGFEDLWPFRSDGLAGALRGDALRRADDLRGARAAYEKALSRRPGDTDYRSALADLDSERSEHHRAVGELESLREAFPDDRDVATAFASSLSRRGDLDRAFDEARRRRPDDPRLLSNALVDATRRSMGDRFPDLATRYELEWYGARLGRHEEARSARAEGDHHAAGTDMARIARAEGKG